MTSTEVDFEIAIIGGGVSGLTLAYCLAEHLLPTTSILLVDKDDDPDYNLSFWSDRETPFEPVMQRTWHNIDVRYGDKRTVCPLSRYTLRAFWRDEFDLFTLEKLNGLPNVTLLEASVTGTSDEGDHVVVQTGEADFRARWAFDSRRQSMSPELNPDLMMMQGLAIEIESDGPAFNPEVATLFDFLLDTPQFDFIYFLPHTERYALVNVAYVTPYESVVTKAECESVLADYIANRLGCLSYETRKACYGRIPLASRSEKRVAGRRVVPIGIRAGMIKASTSYAFTRILRDAENITQALRSTGQPYYKRGRPGYYRSIDRRTARVFQTSPKLAQELMFTMFTPGNGDLALSFLDERNTLSDNWRLFQGIPRSTLLGFLRQLAASL